MVAFWHWHSSIEIILRKHFYRSHLEAPSLEQVFDTITKLYNIVQSKKILIDELESVIARKESKSQTMLAKVGDIQSPKLKSNRGYYFFHYYI